MNDKEKELNEWRIRFQASKRVENRKNLLVSFRIMFFLFLSTFLTYYWWIDELKFIGRETSRVRAIVTDERMIHWGRGYYYQTGECYYKVNGKKYKTEFRINEYYLLVKVGDTVDLKIASNKPEISKLDN